MSGQRRIAAGELPTWIGVGVCGLVLGWTLCADAPLPPQVGSGGSSWGQHAPRAAASESAPEEAPGSALA